MKVAYNFLHCGFHVRRRPSLSRPASALDASPDFSGPTIRQGRIDL